MVRNIVISGKNAAPIWSIIIVIIAISFKTSFRLLLLKVIDIVSVTISPLPVLVYQRRLARGIKRVLIVIACKKRIDFVIIDSGKNYC